MTTDSVCEREIRELHDAWFQASHAKDLDASMAPIASDIVSYEHSAPLQYTEVDAIREECGRYPDLREAREGEWKMIHQHVSFPIDADSGMAAAGLEP